MDWKICILNTLLWSNFWGLSSAGDNNNDPRNDQPIIHPIDERFWAATLPKNNPYNRNDIARQIKNAFTYDVAPNNANYYNAAAPENIRADSQARLEVSSCDMFHANQDLFQL